MINKDRLVQAFEEIIGWPYASPGSNDQSGIDCSGAFVRAYGLQGARIYHGSNTIYRQHCSAVGEIASTAGLLPGMAVFKCRADGNEPTKYYSDGIGNMYHIGLVTSVNPLRIVHATTPIAKVDSKLGNWSHWGKLSEVYYEGGGSMDEAATGTGIVATQSGALNLRDAPGGAVVGKLQKGGTVELLSGGGDGGDGWYRVRYGALVGYASADYIEKVDEPADDGADDTYTDIVDSVSVPRVKLLALADAMNGVLNYLSGND